MRESEEIGMLILCSCEEYGTSPKWRTISRQSELSHTHLIVCYVVPREIRRQRQGQGEIFVLDMNEEVTYSHRIYNYIEGKAIVVKILPS